MGSFTVQWLDAADFGQDLLEIFITDIEIIMSGEAPNDESDDRKHAVSMETAASLIRYFCLSQEHFLCKFNTDQPDEFSNAYFHTLGPRTYIYSILQLLQHHFQNIGCTCLASSNSNGTSPGAGSGNACSRAEGYLLIGYSR